MFHAKDSVEDLRKARKRCHATCNTASVLPSACSTPLEQLRQLAKKRRVAVDTDALPTRSSNKVKFALENNRVASRAYDHEDLSNAWMSRAEATLVKLGAHVTVNKFKEGNLDYSADCIRGLEVHTDPSRMEKRVARSHTYTRRIIEQQHLLRAIMGKANEQILAKLSHTLSAQDVRDACEVGRRDAATALYLNACDEALRRQADMSHTTNSDKQWNKEFPLQLESEGLMALLQHSMIRSP